MLGFYWWTYDDSKILLFNLKELSFIRKNILIVDTEGLEAMSGLVKIGRTFYAQWKPKETFFFVTSLFCPFGSRGCLFRSFSSHSECVFSAPALGSWTASCQMTIRWQNWLNKSTRVKVVQDSKQDRNPEGLWGSGFFSSLKHLRIWGKEKIQLLLM